MRLIAKLEVFLIIFFLKFSPKTTFFVNKVIALGEFCTKHENFVMDLSFWPNGTLKLYCPLIPRLSPGANAMRILKNWRVFKINRSICWICKVYKWIVEFQKHSTVAYRTYKFDCSTLEFAKLKFTGNEYE